MSSGCSQDRTNHSKNKDSIIWQISTAGIGVPEQSGPSGKVLVDRCCCWRAPALVVYPLMKRTRSETYTLLLEQFEQYTIYNDGVDPETVRYVAVADEFWDEQRVGVRIALCENLEEACAILGDAVLDGYAPDGVYDLETSEKRDVRVSRPVVTAVEGPSSYNILEDA
jgi:hypothetical protein